MLIILNTEGSPIEVLISKIISITGITSMSTKNFVRDFLTIENEFYFSGTLEILFKLKA